MAVKTQVCIIGGGPSGLMTSQILDAMGIENIVLEQRSKSYVLQRIRAGVLETGTIDMLREFGLGERMDREGQLHNGVWISSESGGKFFIDTMKLTGKQMMAYGQTSITEDLYEKREAAGGMVIDEAENVQIENADGQSPEVVYFKNGKEHRITCDYIAGCDGFHGICRRSLMQSNKITSYERTYPFGWLGIMSETPPLPELVYASHSRGFALASQRNPMLSRYYIQVGNNEKIENWSDDRFWDELKSRFPEEIAAQIVTGPSIEKSIAPLRSYVAEPMRAASVFLVGDAAHIVPPTGAKGLNLAFSDVHFLTRALEHFYSKNESKYLDEYSDTALKRVWNSVRFSWWLTRLLHRFDGDTEFERKIQIAEILRLQESDALQTAFAQEYVGLPF